MFKGIRKELRQLRKLGKLHMQQQGITKEDVKKMSVEELEKMFYKNMEK